MNTITLTDLPSRPGKTRAAMFRTVTAGIVALRTHPAATVADDNGAINIWRGRDGLLRGERQRFCVTHSRTCVQTLSRLKAWLKQELPLIS